MTVSEWMNQYNDLYDEDAAETGNDTPVVFHRRAGKPWKVTMDAEDWLLLFERCKSLEKAVSGKKEGGRGWITLSA